MDNLQALIFRNEMRAFVRRWFPETATEAVQVTYKRERTRTHDEETLDVHVSHRHPLPAARPARSEGDELAERAEDPGAVAESWRRAS